MKLDFYALMVTQPMDETGGKEWKKLVEKNCWKIYF